jgi:hypothetical protein
MADGLEKEGFVAFKTGRFKILTIGEQISLKMDQSRDLVGMDGRIQVRG